MYRILCETYGGAQALVGIEIPKKIVLDIVGPSK